MKKLILALILILLVLKPVFGSSYAEELINESETYNNIANVSYQGRSYVLDGIYQSNTLELIVLQDTLNNLITDNETIKGVFYQYRLNTIESSQGETIENPKYLSDKDFNSFVTRIKEKYDATQSKVNDLESYIPSFEESIFNLNFQGAQLSNSIKIFSEFQDSIWNAKLLFYRNEFNSADKGLEDTRQLIPKLELDINTSLKIKEGSSALENALSLINNAKKDGYDVKNIEIEFDGANSLLFEANDDYINGKYDLVGTKIDSILNTTEKITKDVQEIRNSQPTPETVQNVSTVPQTVKQPTGSLIQNNPTLLTAFVDIAVALVIVVIFYKRRTSKFVYHYKSRRFF